jgi:hypothetical protein
MGVKMTDIKMIPVPETFLMFLEEWFDEIQYIVAETMLLFHQGGLINNDRYNLETIQLNIKEAVKLFNTMKEEVKVQELHDEYMTKFGDKEKKDE